MKEKEERVLKKDQTVRVLTKFKRHSTLMLRRATLSCQTPTRPLITHQHKGTMRISHMLEEQSKTPDPDIITIRLIFNPGSKNSSSIWTIEENIRVRK